MVNNPLNRCLQLPVVGQPDCGESKLFDNQNDMRHRNWIFLILLSAIGLYIKYSTLTNHRFTLP